MSDIPPIIKIYGTLTTDEKWQSSYNGIRLVAVGWLGLNGTFSTKTVP